MNKLVPALVSALVAMPACHLVHVTGGSPGSPPASTGTPPGGAPSPTATPGAATPGEGAKGSTPSTANAQRAAIEARLVKVLEGEARHSAAAAHGQRSLVCPVVNGFKGPREPVGVHALHATPHDRTLECFAFDEHDLASKPETYPDVRTFQDHGTIVPSKVPLPEKPKKSMVLFVSDGAFYAVQEGEEFEVLVVPCKDEVKKLSRDFTLAHFDQLCDVGKAGADVFTKDPARAKAVVLSEVKERLLGQAKDQAQKAAEAAAKAEAATLKTVQFPGAVAAADGPAAIKTTRAYLADNPKTGIAPESIKKVAVTSSWRVEKDHLDRPVRRTLDVTVGFARTDAYAVDPNKKCAFATFEVEELFVGGHWSAPKATGAQSKWTHVLCSRIE